LLLCQCLTLAGGDGRPAHLPPLRNNWNGFLDSFVMSADSVPPLMADLLGFILDLVLEVLIQAVFEAGVDAASRASRSRDNGASPSRANRRFRFVPFLRLTLNRTNPPFTILKFTLLGLALSFVSILILPHPLLHPSRFHGVSLLISPVITGLIMGFIGRTVRRRGKIPVQIESFAYGFTFAFSFAWIRFLLVH
jgi:hypothetical protein